MAGPTSAAACSPTDMSAWLIAFTGCIYAYIALEQGFKGNWPMCVVYTGYAIGNVGLYVMATK